MNLWFTDFQKSHRGCQKTEPRYIPTISSSSDHEKIQGFDNLVLELFISLYINIKLFLIYLSKSENSSDLIICFTDLINWLLWLNTQQQNQYVYNHVIIKELKERLKEETLYIYIYMQN